MDPAQATATPDTERSRPAPLLVSCVVVCRQQLPGLLPHVVQQISDFVDIDSNWTIPRACRANNLRILDLLAARESPDLDFSKMSARFADDLKIAVENDSLEVAVWLRKYCPAGNAAQVIRMAALKMNFPMHLWLALYCPADSNHSEAGGIATNIRAGNGHGH